MDAEALATAAPLLLYLTFGLIYCFFGSRFLKTMMIGLGALFGAALGTLLAHLLFKGHVVALLTLGLIGGLAGAWLFKTVYNLAIFMAGFAVGSLLAPLIAGAMGFDQGDAAGWLIVLLGSSVCGLLALLLEKQIMILFSAATGAVVATIAFQLLLAHKYEAKPGQLMDAYEDTFQRTWWLVIVLIVAGVCAQWKRKPASSST